METIFKFVFFLAILIFMLTSVGLFLLLVKILLHFYPEVVFLDILFRPAL